MNKSLAMLRDRKTDTAGFRAASDRLGALLMRETESLLRKRKITEKSVVAVAILRAGFALVEPALHCFPNAPVGVFGMRRDERTFAPHWYYENLPPLSKRSVVVILDPMLATGGTAEAAATRLIKRGVLPERIYFVGVIAAPEGLARLTKRIPRENVVLAAVDKGLNKNNYIMPGLGDFGDRYFGYRR